MSKTYAIKISQLVPGLMLAEDLVYRKTGQMLIPSQTVINDNHLKRLNYFDVSGTCVVFDPSYSTDHQEVIDGYEDSTDKLNPLPEIINEKTRRVYTETFEVIKQFFKKDQNINDNDIHEIKEVATNISEEIVRDPYVLPQIAILKAIDNYTFSHSIHVAIYATTLARFLGYPPEKLREISSAGLLHDIGKMDIPRDIVDKPGPLTESEFVIMKQHAWYSYERLKNFKNISKDIIAAVSQHHEKNNGTGYYQGLKGSEIHPWANILAIGDVYDALTTDRVYREALLPHEGAEIVMGSSIGHLDYENVKVFTSKMSLYPIGTKVALSTGETGRVTSHQSSSPLRPVITIKRGSKEWIVDLSKNHTIFITHLIN